MELCGFHIDSFLYCIILTVSFPFSWQVDGVAVNLAKRNELISHLFTLLEERKTFK